MKKLLTLLVLFFCLNADAQYVNIVDKNLGKYIFENIPGVANWDSIQNIYSLDTTLSRSTGIINFNASNLGITNVDILTFFGGFTFLNISHNLIDSLPVLPNGILSLDCSYNNIKSLKNIPIGLSHLICNNNLLKELPPFNYDWMLTINCKKNDIYCLPKLPIYIADLIIDTNKIKCIPQIYAYLNVYSDTINNRVYVPNCNYLNNKFNCSCIDFVNIPDTSLGKAIVKNSVVSTGFGNKPTFLAAFWDSSNNTSWIDTLNPIITDSVKLISFNLNNNERIKNLFGLHFFKKLKILGFFGSMKVDLNKLDFIPNTVENMVIMDSKIDSFAKLPDSLKTLWLNNCKLGHFSDLPENVTNLTLDNNNLISLPILPKKLEVLTCDSNNIICFPVLPKSLLVFSGTGNPAKCIPNIPNDFIQSTIQTLCNPTNNVNNCQSFPTIQSYAYTNIGNKPTKQNIKLNVSNLNHTYTNQQGIAYINADSLGTYTITAQAPPLYQVVPPSYTHTFNKYDTIVYDTFALQPFVSKDSLAVKITPINWAARPGFSYAYNINFENVGTTILNTNLNVKLDTSKYIFDSCSNVNSSFTGNTLSLALNNFVPGQNDDFIIYGKLKTTTSLGSSLIATASFVGGNATATDTVNTIVRGSYDPNDKQATPNLSVAQVASDNNYINYTIRFQNTGTDTAFTVVIADSLNGNMLQLNTLQVIGSSHTVKPTQKDNVVFFEFRDILLPDSTTNKIGSNGFVSFKIKPKTTLTNGNVVPNNAAIYFDYNNPIITNTANTIIGTLPLTLLNFMASPTPPKEGLINVLLSWNTSNEINTSHFVIEQSTDAKNFKAITEVKAKGIGSNSYYYQSSVDRQLSTVFFRLKMIDKDGKFSYSPIREIRTQKSETITIISPVKNELKVVVNSNSLINTKASIINSLGKVVNVFVLSNIVNSINISSLSNGVYYLNTTEGSRKFVVAK